MGSYCWVAGSLGMGWDGMLLVNLYIMRAWGDLSGADEELTNITWHLLLGTMVVCFCLGLVDGGRDRLIHAVCLQDFSLRQYSSGRANRRLLR
jgi:hypothetical protein